MVMVVLCVVVGVGVRKVLDWVVENSACVVVCMKVACTHHRHV